MKLIANMVAKNEGHRFLPEVLDHLKTITEFIVFTDDASTDNTPEIAESYGCKIQRLDKSLFSVDEHELRTVAWKHLERFAEPGDWILAIDADEKLYGTSLLRHMLDQTWSDVLGITFYHMWSPTHYRSDKLWAPGLSSRLFRYHPGGEFAKRKLACGSEPTYVQELIRQQKALWQTNLRMQHLGYVRDEDKLAKYKRYMELDGGNYHNRAHLESIMDIHPTLEEWRG